MHPKHTVSKKAREINGREVKGKAEMKGDAE